MLELEAGSAGDFKVVEPSDSDDVLLAGDGKWWARGDRISIVKPDLLWCSCGVWQDFSPVPCMCGLQKMERERVHLFSYELGTSVVLHI